MRQHVTVIGALAVFNLLNFPLGTAVAVYTIWILMQEETAQLFASDSRW
jgi:hypothetical protein